MTDKIFIHQNIQPIKPSQKKPPKAHPVAQPNVSFQEMLDGARESIKFSQHAQKRLADRNISLSPQELQKINNAVDKAGQKGARESLILMDNVAFVVSVKNKTVVTAVDGQNLKENVFTNIDSAVII